jgi:glucose/arabinose dehydrogenase
MRSKVRGLIPRLGSFAIAFPVCAGALLAQEEAAPLVVPDGFEVQVYASGLGVPAAMAFGSDDALYVALSDAGEIVRLIDRDGDGAADERATTAIAWAGADLWVAESGRIGRVRAPSSAAGPEYEVVIDSLPTDGPPVRSLLFEPRGRAFYLALGASCDLCPEEDPRHGTILRYDMVVRELAIWARGLQAVGGLAFHPETRELWATESGRDGLGDRLPPDELNVIQRGRHYGWPYCYGHRVPNPEFADNDRCDVTVPPILSLPAHSSPRGLTFYRGDAFPQEYWSDAFVVLAGEAVSAVPLTGRKVVRLRVEAGRAVGVEEFMTGWWGSDGRASGRPAGALVGPDGALYVNDDAGGRIWRVSYRPEGDH